MPQAPGFMQPVHPGMGYSQQPNPFWKALEGVVNGLRGAQFGQAQPWGMNHEPTLTASQAVQPALQGAGQVLSDPRNSWMGVGPLAGMALMGKGIRGAMPHVVPGGGPSMGGFNVPTATMRQAMDMPRLNLRQGEVPGGNEQRVRAEYLAGIDKAHALAEILQNPSHPS
jgi:hypothetical protein